MKAIPDWPRMMCRSTAAAYLDMPVTDFERELSKGRLPMPIELGGGERWSRTLIDEALARLTGERNPDVAMQSNFFVRVAAPTPPAKNSFEAASFGTCDT